MENSQPSSSHTGQVGYRDLQGKREGGVGGIDQGIFV